MNLLRKLSTLKKTFSEPFGLSSLIKVPRKASATSQLPLAVEYAKMLTQFFDIQDNGMFSTKKAEINLLNTKTTSVPLLSMVTPKGLTLKTLDVTLTQQMSALINQLDTVKDKSSHESTFRINLNKGKS